MPENLKTVFDRLFDEVVKERARFFGLHVAGIEVTQSIQHYDAAAHLTQAADRGRDNSVPLIAGKTTFVRVYVRNPGGDLPGVTGTLSIERPQPADLSWTPVATLSPWGSSSVTAEANPSRARERGSLWRTLNFRLPLALVRGRMRLTATITAPGGQMHSMSVDVAASLRQTLRIRGVPIRYDGQDLAGNKLVLPRPSLADFAATASDALAMFPVLDEPDITLTGDFNWFAPLSGAPDADNPGGCAPSWNSLLFWLALMKTADGNRTDRIYYGLLPAGTPTGFNSGCGSAGGVSAGLAGDRDAFAHECGHVLGLKHSPCGLTPGDLSDPGYPAYEPYDTPANRMASIGEYGLDTRSPSVQPPNQVRDFMSYCAPAWIGLHHYQALVQHPLLAPRAVVERGPRLPDWVYDNVIPERALPRPPGPGPVELEFDLVRQRPLRREALVTVTGLMTAGRLERAELLRLPTRVPALGAVLPGSRIELLDANGQVLASARLRRLALAGGCGCGGGCGGCGGGSGTSSDCGADEPGYESGLLQAVLPEHKAIAVVRIGRDDQTLWQREADGEVGIGRLNAHVESDGLAASWLVDVAGLADGAVLHVMLRVATVVAAAGTDPHGSATGTNADPAAEAEWDVAWSWSGPAPEVPQAATVALATLSPGRVQLEAVVCDGFHTRRTEAIELELPPRAPAAAVLWPREGGAVRCGEAVLMRGMGVAADGTPLPDAALEWTLDGAPAGSGREVLAALGAWEGEHRAVLRVRDRHGESQAEVVFAATCSGEPPVRLRRS